jgi:hypothetical protein
MPALLKNAFRNVLSVSYHFHVMTERIANFTTLTRPAAGHVARFDFPDRSAA